MIKLYLNGKAVGSIGTDVAFNGNLVGGEKNMNDLYRKTYSFSLNTLAGVPYSYMDFTMSSDGRVLVASRADDAGRFDIFKKGSDGVFAAIPYLNLADTYSEALISDDGKTIAFTNKAGGSFGGDRALIYQEQTNGTYKLLQTLVGIVSADSQYGAGKISLDGSGLGIAFQSTNSAGYRYIRVFGRTAINKTFTQKASISGVNIPLPNTGFNDINLTTQGTKIFVDAAMNGYETGLITTNPLIFENVSGALCSGFSNGKLLVVGTGNVTADVIRRYLIKDGVLNQEPQIACPKGFSIYENMFGNSPYRSKHQSNFTSLNDGSMLLVCNESLSNSEVVKVYYGRPSDDNTVSNLWLQQEIPGVGAFVSNTNPNEILILESPNICSIYNRAFKNFKTS